MSASLPWQVISAQPEKVIEGLLYGGAFADHPGETLTGVEPHDLSDVGQLSHHDREAHCEIRFLKPVEEKLYQEEPKDAHQRVDPDFLICPVVQGFKAEVASIFEIAEVVFDDILCMIGGDDLGRRQPVLITEDDGLAEAVVGLVDFPLFRFNLEPADVLASDLDPKIVGELFGVEVVFVFLDKGFIALYVFVLFAFLVEAGRKLGLGPFQAPVEGPLLPVVELGVESDDHRTFPAKNRGSKTAGPVAVHLLGKVIQGDLEKLGILGRLETAKAIYIEAVCKLDVVLGVVALVKDQGQFFGALSQLVEALDKEADGLRKELGILTVAFVEHVPQRESPPFGGGHGDPHEPLPRAAFLCFSSLRQFARGQSVDIGGEVAVVIEEGVADDLVLIEGCFPQGFFNGGDVFGRHPLHCVPEALAVKGRRLLADQPWKDALLHPGPDAVFALGADGPVNGADGQEGANGDLAVGFLGDDIVDDFCEPKLLDLLPQGGRCPELLGLDLNGLFSGLDFLKDGVSSAEVDLVDNTGLAVDALGFDRVVVLLALDDFLDQRCHD